MIKIKVKLKTDFLDFYDHWFDHEGIIFERMSKNNISRSKMFKLFKKYNIHTPINGIVNEINDQVNLDDWVVVYLNEYEHQGKGKMLCRYIDAFENYSNYYCSKFINMYVATSWRELHLGDYSFILKYRSNDLWRSNVGKITITIEGDDRLEISRTFDYPIYAIDYVSDIDPTTKEIKFYAIDLNTSPMVRGTGIEELVSAKDIAESIKKYIKNK